MTITEGMAAATTPGLYHTAEGAHIEGVDFAGKTGTAQVVGGGDTHVKGGAKTPNSWFVGMVPRRNPEIVITVLQEHGDWGSNSAHIAAAMVATYVNKQRRKENNLEKAGDTKPVEMGAVWVTPAPHQEGAEDWQRSTLHAGRYTVDVGRSATPAATASTGTRSVAAGQLPLPAWMMTAPLRFKQDQ